MCACVASRDAKKSPSNALVCDDETDFYPDSKKKNCIYRLKAFYATTHFSSGVQSFAPLPHDCGTVFH